MRRAVRVVGVVALLVVVVVLLFLVLNWYVDPTKPSDRKDLVLALAQILGGTALLSGLYFTWRSLQVNREGQITERFTRAIDQLGASDDAGNPRLEIRVGGIYALERIARDSAARDYSTVIEVLMAYVRQNVKWSPNSLTFDQTPEQIEQTSGSRLPDDVIEHFTHARESKLPGIRADIQAALNVLGRREEHRVPESLRVRLALQGTDLSGANLSGANLSGADLSDANLSRADLHNANLSHISLYRSFFWEANLSDAKLSDAMLWDANLSGAIAFGADLSDAALRRAYLCGATLERSNLSGADLSEADCSAIRFVERDDVSGVVRRIWGRETNLSDVNLSGADLSGANFSMADLSGADLSGADLPGADLSGTNLTQEQLELAQGDENTQLPSHLKPPEHWSGKTDEQPEED